MNKTITKSIQLEKMIKNRIAGRLLIGTLVLLIASCSPSDDKMRVKLNRKIEKTQDKIAKLENKTVGYQQRLAMLEDSISVNVSEQIVVTTVQPESKKFEKFIEIQGAVSSKNNVIISSNSGGVIMSMAVTEGQYISRGQVIAVINSDVLQSSIQEVESALDLATSVFERQERLWVEQQIGTEIQYLQAKNNKENLEKKLATLQVQLDDATVRSSLSGVVDMVIGKQGELVGPGSPLARVVNLDRVQVGAEIPENYITNFKKGDKVEVFFPALKM